VLDFAFRIHTDIGLRFKNALVNGRIVPIDYKLKNGDIVEIKTYKNRYSASKSWLDILYTPSAKAKLSRFLKQLARKELLQLGEKKVNDFLKQYDLPTLYSKQDIISKELGKEELEKVLVNIGEGKESVIKFVKKFYPQISQEEKEKSQERKQDLEKENLSGQVIVDIDKKIDYTLCKECNPKPGDKIIARAGKDGIKIHKLDCKALKNVSLDKLIEAHWE
jgi:GTP pyrophosphokinase